MLNITCSRKEKIQHLTNWETKTFLWPNISIFYKWIQVIMKIKLLNAPVLALLVLSSGKRNFETYNDCKWHLQLYLFLGYYRSKEWASQANSHKMRWKATEDWGRQRRKPNENALIQNYNKNKTLLLSFFSLFIFKSLILPSPK